MRGLKLWQPSTMVVITMSVVVTAILCGSAIAQSEAETPSGQRLINIDVKDGAIDQVLRMLAKAAEVNIVIGENVTGRVEAVSLRDVTVETALRLITITHGYYWYREGNVYVVTANPPPSAGGMVPAHGPTGRDTGASRGEVRTVSPETGGAVSGSAVGPAMGGSAASPPLVTPEVSTIVTQGAAGEPRLVTKMIPLKYKNAQELAWAFGGTAFGSEIAGGNLPAQRLADRPRLMRRNAETYAGPDIFGGGTSRTGLGQDAGLGGGRQTGGRQTGGRQTGGRQTGGFGGGSGGLGNLLSGEMEPPTAFMPENALIVQGTQAEIDQFVGLVEMLDVPARQVEIATKFVDVATTAQDAFGIDWSVANGALEFWNLGFAPGEAVNNVIRYTRGQFQATLAALQNEGRATVINAPHVTCPNNMMAEISFYTTIPFYTSTTEYNQFGQRIATTVEWEDMEVENSMMVLPRINADDTVTIELYPILEDQVGEVVGPNGETMPIIVSQEVMTTVTVADGDTIVMGGLMRKDDSTTYQNTPLLSKLPIIGNLFRAKKHRISNSELLIFVTPRIIRDVPPQ